MDHNRKAWNHVSASTTSVYKDRLDDKFGTAIFYCKPFKLDFQYKPKMGFQSCN